VAREAGLLQLGTVAIDGTKVKESVSLKAEIEELTSRVVSTDAQEDAEYGSENSGDEIPEELKRREQRLGKIEDAIQRLRSRQEAEDRRTAARRAVPSSRLIVAAQVSQSGAKHDQLMPVLEVAESNIGERPKAVLADARYWSEENFQKL
jgi:hypothetical protein